MDKGIYGKMCVLMSEVGAIAKDNRNQAQGYNFRSIEQVMDRLNPALRKARVALSTKILEQSRDKVTTARGATMMYSVLRLEVTFWDCDDGSSITAEAVGEGMDTGDKASNKAMSAAFKYAVFMALSVPTHEMVDPDAESPEVAALQVAVATAKKSDAQQAAAKGDYSNALLYLERDYADALAGEPMEKIKYAREMDEDLKGMYERTVMYLKRKGAVR